MNQETITHLQFIQNIIDRMNRNSFQIKGWCVAIVSAFLALYANSSNPLYIYVAWFPILVLWWLDAIYLQQERKFRGVYADVVSQNSKVAPFQMPLHLYRGGKYTLVRVWISKTLALFYGVLMLCLVVGAYLLVHNSDEASAVVDKEIVCPPCQSSPDSTNALSSMKKEPAFVANAESCSNSTNNVQPQKSGKPTSGVSDESRKDN